MTGPQASRRSDLQRTPDQRVRDTRQRLIEAYRASASAPGAVSVISVCRAAGVGRSTFYTHYETIEDLAVATIIDAFNAGSLLDLRRRATPNSSAADSTRAGLAQMVSTLEELREVVLDSVRTTSWSALAARLTNVVELAVRSAIEVEAADPDEAELTVTATFVAAGTVHTTLRWLERDDRDQRALVGRLMHLMPAVLANDMPREALTSAITKTSLS